MFSNVPCSVSPLQLDLHQGSNKNVSSSSSVSIRRKSKSLDDIISVVVKQDPLSCYLQDTCTPTSPIVTFIQKPTAPAPPKRRHSLCAAGEKPSNMEYIRLAKIYGWVYHSSINNNATDTTTHESRRLRGSKSFSHIPTATGGGTKLTRMFGRCTNTATSLTSLFPNKSTTTASSATNLKPFKKKKAAIAAAKEKEQRQKQQKQKINLEKEKVIEPEQITAVEPPQQIPEPPIENDPHVFDLLSKDSSSFIHYGKKNDDTTVTSATVEKLVEKLTREMDNEFLMDFFLTFRQFTTPIKLCKLLILRFRWALLLEEQEDRRLVRIRTFVVIRHWLTHYWTYDFLTSRTLRFMLCTWLTQLQTHPVILNSPRDERIIKNLRSVLKRQRKFYQNWSPNGNGSSSTCNRKDSAIGISTTCKMRPPEKMKEEHKQQQDISNSNKWTSKVKRSIRRSIVSTSFSTANVAACNCSTTSNNNSASTLASSNCTLHTNITQPTPAVMRSLFLSRMTPSPQQQPYKSIILKYRSEIIAQQFCIIEQTMLQKVTWDELVELRWRKRSSKRQSFVIDLPPEELVEGKCTDEEGENIGVDRLIGFFNMTCQWVASEVVRSQHMETRVKVIEKLIRIALKCYHHRNYSTLMQILLGLQSPSVSRLTRTWQKVDSNQIDLFNQLKELAKPFRNWKNVRDYMTKATEEVAESFAVESVLTDSLNQVTKEGGGARKNGGDEGQGQGCIPFLGLYLSDLVFIAELPTWIESSYVSSSDEDNEDCKKQQELDKELCERLSHHLVNYNKFRITASVVKHVLAFQVLSRNYNFKMQAYLYTQLSQQMILLDNSQIRKASFLCEES